MGDEAVAAIFDSGVCIGIISAAGRTQGIKRTIAEQTVEVLRVFRFVTGEVFAFRVLKKRVAAFFRLGAGRVFFVHHILYLSFFYDSKPQSFAGPAAATMSIIHKRRNFAPLYQRNSRAQSGPCIALRGTPDIPKMHNSTAQNRPGVKNARQEEPFRRNRRSTTRRQKPWHF